MDEIGFWVGSLFYCDFMFVVGDKDIVMRESFYKLVGNSYLFWDW